MPLRRENKIKQQNSMPDIIAHYTGLIEEGTQWVAFEPNDERTWSRVREAVSNILTNAWREGALIGTKPSEAFFVHCDQSIMTQADIDSGRLIAEVGIAPIKPAEFVVFRVSQWTGGVDVDE